MFMVTSYSSQAHEPTVFLPPVGLTVTVIFIMPCIIDAIWGGRRLAKSNGSFASMYVLDLWLMMYMTFFSRSMTEELWSDSMANLSVPIHCSETESLAGWFCPIMLMGSVCTLDLT